MQGRQKCKECGRYRCKHTVFSGGIAYAERVKLNNNNQEFNRNKSPTAGNLAKEVGIKVMPVRFDCSSGEVLV